MIPVLVAACADPPRPCGLGLPQIVAVTTDFGSGALAVVDPATGARCDDVASAGPDAAVRAWPGGAAVFDRTGGTSLRLYRPGDWTAPTREIGVEPGSNLHDVASWDGDLWLAPFERDVVLRLDAHGRPLGEVSLADWADGDGLPEVDRLVPRSGGLYAGLQRLDRDAGWSSDHGVVARLDADGVHESWDVGPDPKLFADPSDDGALVALTGVFGARDGGLERLDPGTGIVRTVLDERDLGYDLDGFAGIGAATVVLGVDDDGVSRWGCLDLDAEGWVEGDPDPGWYVDAVAGEDAVYVAVRTGWAEGARDRILAIDPVACERTVLSDDLRLDPFSIAWVTGP